MLKLIYDSIRYLKKISLSKYKAYKNLLYYRNRLVIPNHDELKLKLLKHVYGLLVASHPGRGKTLELLQREYYWLNMHNMTRRYVSSCHICRRAKASHETYNGLLKPLPALDRRWKNISIDFVVGLPETIISDRGSQFVFAFWKELTTRLRIKALLSTAYYPETDGQTERVNAIIEQYIRIYISYLQDNWINWLAFAKFTANNFILKTTKVSLFLANYRQYL